MPSSPKAEFRTLFLLVVAFMYGGGVDAAPQKNTVKQAAPTWPRPPDAPLFRYEYTLRTLADVEVKDDRNWFQRMVSGQRDVTNDLVLDKPVAIAARNGRVLVADSAKKMIVVFDIPRRRVYPFGVRDDAGRLMMPVAIALDSKMRAYVVDSQARRVHVYDDMGLYTHSIGSPATLGRPTGIAVDAKGESIYVVDRSDDKMTNPRVVCFDAKGRMKHTVGSSGDGPGQLRIPLKVALDDDGNLYVLDVGNLRISVFAPDGQFIRMFGGPGSGPGALSRPRGLAVAEHVYVADAAFGNVQIFDKRGNVMLFVGSLAKSPTDHSAGEYSLISDVAVDETRRIYIVDQYFRKIEIIKPIGTPPATP